jgi:hypothetical protein
MVKMNEKTIGLDLHMKWTKRKAIHEALVRTLGSQVVFDSIVTTYVDNTRISSEVTSCFFGTLKAELSGGRSASANSVLSRSAFTTELPSIGRIPLLTATALSRPSLIIASVSVRSEA